MKKLSFALLSLLFSTVLIAQIPKEAFDLSNSLYDLWKTSPKEKAVEVSLKLNTLYQPFLIDNLHHNFAQVLLRERTESYPQDYLKTLMEAGNPAVKSIVEPMSVWNQAFDVTSKADAKALIQKMNALLKDSTDAKAKTEFYGLMLLKTLKSKELLPDAEQRTLLEKIVSNLKKYPYLETPMASQAALRAWHRYLLSYAMFQKFLTQGEQEDAIKAAALYSPDPMDMTRSEGFFYDAAMLESKTREVGFQNDYIRFLDKNKRYAEELAILLDKTFVGPVDGQVNNLKTFLGQRPELGEFKQVWSTYVNSRMKQTPALKVSYTDGVFDFTKPRKEWTLIDTWGTWCSPCVKELPRLNRLAAEYNNQPDSKVRIRTFSYMSSKLPEFMETNKYTFPVVEVGDEVTKPFGINSFPTKMLVSPDNKYLIIPFHADWNEYLRNYVMIETNPTK